MTAVPYTAAPQNSAGRCTQQPLHGKQREHPWQRTHRLQPLRSSRSPGPSNLLPVTTFIYCLRPRPSRSRLKLLRIEHGTRNSPLSCGDATGQSSLAGSGRITSIRFSSVGLWNSFINGW